MECLRDWIGVLNCAGLDEPESDLYINSLPGMSLDMLDKIANADQATFAGVYDDIQTTALGHLDLEIIKELRKRYRIKTVQQSVDLLRRVDTSQAVAAAAKWRGFTAELTFENESGLVSSVFQQFSFQSFSLYVTTGFTGTVNIKIFDLTTGLVLDTIVLTNPVTGWNLISVNRKYSAYRIFVGYDATLVDSCVQDISQTADCFCDWASGSVRIRGAESAALSSTITDTNLTIGSSTSGLSSIVAIQCNYNSFICNNKDVFTLPLQYLIGAVTMAFRINTNRLNRYTTVDRKQAQELKDYYDTEWKSLLETALAGIDIDLSDSCIECHAQLTTVEARL